MEWNEMEWNEMESLQNFFITRFIIFKSFDERFRNI
jgi:hypothetical protein